MANKITINTEGGAAANDVNTGGGSFVGRDHNVVIIVNKWNWDKVFEEYIARKIKDLPFAIKEQSEKAERERKTAETAIRKHWQEWNWQVSAKSYGESLAQQFSTIRILGKSESVKLEGIFTDLYLLDEITARLRYDIVELRKRRVNRSEFSHQVQKRYNGIEFVKKDYNLFILGKPGAGKTTFLKYIAMQAIQSRLDKTPIFVSLKEWAMTEFKSLMPFLVQQFAICNFPDAQPFIEQLLNTGKAIVLFDGLDEVNQEANERANLIRLLQDFAKQYSKSQCLITCRIAASEYHFNGFKDMEIADFTTDQIKIFAKKWFAGQEEKRTKFILDLYKEENEGLRELCSIPLLLSMLCLAFDDNMSFPSHRAELYEDALEALLRKWDTSRSIQRDEIYRGLLRKRKEQLFAYIAAPSFEKGEYFLQRKDLEKNITKYLAELPNAESIDDIDSYAVLKAIEMQHSILVERAKDIYSFSHLSFHEYFTARHIVNNEARGSIKKLIYHLTDNRWREVFLLTASQLENTDDFFLEMNSVIAELETKEITIAQAITWADTKVDPINIHNSQRSAIRLAYIFLHFSFSLARVLIFDFDFLRALDLDLDHSRALARAFDLAFTRALDHIVEPHLTHALDLTLNLARSLNLDLDIYQVRAHVLAFKQAIHRVQNLSDLYDPNLGLDFGLLYLWQMALILGHIESLQYNSGYVSEFSHYFNEIIELSQEVDALDLTKALASLVLLNKDANQAEWRIFADKLRHLIQIHRSIGNEWKLNTDNIRKVTDYLYAKELQARCLKLARVSNRQAFEESLLLLPKTRTGS